MSLQYYPEVSPGPLDSDTVFREFMELLEKAKAKSLKRMACHSFWPPLLATVSEVGLPQVFLNLNG
uniref:Uncharacterized protein n=1 Tax=Rhizophora mucronata TaxID=61149 RepID=A0A2P2N2I4_RHIMU